MPGKKRKDKIQAEEQAVTLIPDEDAAAPVEEQPVKLDLPDDPPTAEEEGAPVDSVIRIGETVEGAKKLNAFDRFWIKVWAIIVSAFTAMANGINFVIFKIFKKRIPDRYIIAVLATILIILLILLVSAPFKITVNAPDEMEIYPDGLTPVYTRVGDSAAGYPLYKWGYADDKGKIVIECKYDDVTEFKHGVAFVNSVTTNDDGSVENYWMLIDTKGRQKGENRIYYSTELGDKLPVGEFGDDVKLAPVYIGGKYAYMNTRGELQIQAIYDEAGVFKDGYARVRQGSSVYFINDNNEYLGNTGYDDARDFCEGMAAVKSNGLWMFIDTDGDRLKSNKSELVFDRVSDFTDGYALVRNGTTLSVIDKDGNFVVTGNTFNDLKIADKFDTSWW